MLFSRFAGDHRGNVAPIFAIALIPLLGFVGAAVDYSRASSAKTDMQAALDSTALMIAKEAPNLTTSQITTKANTYFNAIFNRKDATISGVTADYTSSSSTVVIKASGSIKTSFMGILGVSEITFGGSSTSKWGTTRLRVALVLDTTGSMASAGKMDALKTATKNLLTQLQGTAVNDGDVYVSIIPFSKDVNAGPSNYSATWIDWTSWEAEPVFTKPSNWDQIGPGSSCPFNSYNHGFQCMTGPTTGAQTTSTIPSSGTYSGYICPSMDNGRVNAVKNGIYYNGCYNSVPTTTTTTNVVGTGRYASCSGYSNCICTGSGRDKVCTQTITMTGAPYTHTWIKNDHSTWTGCVADRGTASAPSQDYDRKVTAPTASDTATLFPAEQYYYCSPSMMQLSYNWSGMKTMVDSLYPSGSTNQPIGLVWGWQSLVGGGPLTAPAKDANYQYNEVIILLSDGLNTQDRWFGNGSSTSTQVDTRMYESSTVGTCANIKAAGITIYAVQVNTDGDPTSSVMKYCASDLSKFFVLTSANQIVTTFATIGTNLAKLRIAY